MAGKRRTKTFLMQLIESQHPGQTIESLMQRAFRETGTEREAAEVLGITQQVFNVWKYRLGLAENIAEIAKTKEGEN